MKKFGDLQKGDDVFLLKIGSDSWKIIILKVLEVKVCGVDIKLTLDDYSWSGYFPKSAFCAIGDSLWSDKEEMLSYSLECAKRKRDYLVETIDKMIIQHDMIEKFIKEYEVESAKEID